MSLLTVGLSLLGGLVVVLAVAGVLLLRVGARALASIEDESWR